MLEKKRERPESDVKDEQENKIHISMEVVNKLEQKREINNIRFLYNLNDITILNFEIFCTKWERYVLIEKDIIKVSVTVSNIKEKLNELKSDYQISIHKIGSIYNSTARNNCLEFELIVEFDSKFKNDDIVDKCFEKLNDLWDQGYISKLDNINNKLYEKEDQDKVPFIINL
jgi:hypothetical protein